MPLVRISLLEGKSESYIRAVADAVHRAMITTIVIPADDRFQVITEHKGARLVYDPAYLGIERSADFILIQITISAGRSVEQKQALYQRMVELLKADLNVRPEDVFINLVEVAKENWSFGNGVAQYAANAAPSEAHAIH